MLQKKERVQKDRGEFGNAEEKVDCIFQQSSQNKPYWKYST